MTEFTIVGNFERFDNDGKSFIIKTGGTHYKITVAKASVYDGLSIVQKGNSLKIKGTIGDGIVNDVLTAEKIALLVGEQ